MSRKTTREQILFINALRTRQRERHLKWLRAKRQSQKRAQEHKRLGALTFGTSSEIAGMLSEGCSQGLPMRQTSLLAPVPETFSLFEAPEKALEFIAQLARTHRDRPISDVYVAFSLIKSQDLGAHAILDKLVDEMALQAQFRGERIAWRGDYPKDQAQARFVKAMGIIRQLRISHEYLQPKDLQKITIFERSCKHHRVSSNPRVKDEKSNAVERFVDYVNGCLNKEKKQLTPIARHHLCSYVSEVIDNAEQHAGFGDWGIKGYLDTAAESPQCEIVIFNFGKTISQTLDELPRDGYTWQQIGPYLDLHQRQGWFSPRWRKEDLLTVLALQPAVSSKNNSESTTRGNGTTELIGFFQKMSEERHLGFGSKTHMYIISGTTRIVFDGRYRLGPSPAGRSLLAFNEGNDLSQPPDRSCVMPLKTSMFPGTIIGLKFPILPTSVEAPHEQDHR